MMFVTARESVLESRILLQRLISINATVFTLGTVYLKLYFSRKSQSSDY